MGEGLLQPMHWVVILAIALLVFGPKRLPELGKSLGQAIRGFKASMHEVENEQTTAKLPAAREDATGKTQQPS
jgi:sec-independent protein translocase protein TatA